MNFIFISLQRIGADRESTSTQLARELARQGHQVLYVNAPLNRKDLYFTPSDPFARKHLERRKQEILVEKLSPRLWVYYPRQVMDSFNWVPSTALFAQLLKFNNSRLAKDIRQAAALLEFDSYTLLNDKVIYRGLYLKELLQPAHFLYLDRDHTIIMDYWRRHGPTLEPVLMRKADAVLCNSLDFTDRARQYNPASHYIGNGFDNRLYADTLPRPVPADLADIPGPIIGYVGALLTLRLDLPLLLTLAQRHPAWSFVLIGREDECFAGSALHQLPNVYFLGHRHPNEVPGYIQAFDVCINPQLLNEITIGNFPLKILEYLALGKPVVATATNTMREVFSEHTYLATGLESYETQLAKALREDSAGKARERRAFVDQFSWQRVAGRVLDIVHGLPASQASPEPALVPSPASTSLELSLSS